MDGRTAGVGSEDDEREEEEGTDDDDSETEGSASCDESGSEGGGGRSAARRARGGRRSASPARPSALPSAARWHELTLAFEKLHQGLLRALGADAVGCGKPYLYGLAAGGEEGVVKALQILKVELDRAMGLLGVANVEQLKKEGPMLIKKRGYNSVRDFPYPGPNGCC
jgi:hypothetical protein